MQRLWPGAARSRQQCSAAALLTPMGGTGLTRPDIRVDRLYASPVSWLPAGPLVQKELDRKEEAAAWHPWVWNAHRRRRLCGGGAASSFVLGRGLDSDRLNSAPEH